MERGRTVERRREGDLVVCRRCRCIAFDGELLHHTISHYRTIHYRSIYRNATHMESMHYSNRPLMLIAAE